jgi:hypothetical protein
MAKLNEVKRSSGIRPGKNGPIGPRRKTSMATGSGATTPMLAKKQAKRRASSDAVSKLKQKTQQVCVKDLTFDSDEI